MNTSRWIAVGIVSVFVSQKSFAGEMKLLASSGPNRVQVLELYTSESCSSCPPADRWVSELKKDERLWKKFIPIVFHVDYWNNIGWKDGLSSELMTKRQIDISKLWSYLVRAARLGMNISSDIRSGENAGRKLMHDFAVLNWDYKLLDKKGSEIKFEFSKSKQLTSEFAIVAWVEEVGNATPLQATGGYL